MNLNEYNCFSLYKPSACLSAWCLVRSSEHLSAVQSLGSGREQANICLCELDVGGLAPTTESQLIFQGTVNTPSLILCSRRSQIWIYMCFIKSKVQWALTYSWAQAQSVPTGGSYSFLCTYRANKNTTTDIKCHLTAATAEMNLKCMFCTSVFMHHFAAASFCCRLHVLQYFFKYFIHL